MSNKQDYMEDLNSTIETCYTAINSIKDMLNNGIISEYESLTAMSGYLQVALEAKKEYYRLENGLI